MDLYKQFGWCCQKHQSHAKNSSNANAHANAKKKNVPKEVVAKNKILNAQNFMNLVKGVEANKNISTIKTSFCSIS